VSYDRERGISEWSRRYAVGPSGLSAGADREGTHPYYDPIGTLGPTGQAWWAARSG
jgi:lysine 2,3-aminomutase